IQGDLQISNPDYYTVLTIDDSGDSTTQTATVTNSAVTGLAPASIGYAQTDLFQLNINGGTAGNTFNVLSTPNWGQQGTVPTNIPSNANDTVNVGDAGSLQGIQGRLTISNASGADVVTVDGSADTTPSTAMLDKFTDQNTFTTSGSISGLAPAT